MKPPDNDDPDWEAALKGVKPLKKPGTSAALSSPPRRTPVLNLRPREAVAPAIPRGQHEKSGRQIDKGTAKRLQRGKINVEGRLDLHGLTRDQAHKKLNDFVVRAAASDKRCVLVVTGRGELPNPDGTPPKRGAIRREFPHWLDQAPLKHLVLKAISARSEDGGAGAFYLYLRRNRND
jgi:DNA-nicking Smr family endonuclease